MSKLKKIILSLVCITVSLCLLYFGFSEIDVDFEEILSVNSAPVNSTLMTNDQIIEALRTEQVGSPKKNELPDDMNALWIDINKDITAEASEGTDAVKYSIYSDMDFYRNFIPDVFFIKPDTENEYSALKEPDGSDFDILAYFLYYVRSLGCEAVLVADDDILLSRSNKPQTKEIERYLSTYSFNSVLISVDRSYSDSLYVDCAQTVRKLIDEKFSHINVGIEVHSDFEKQFADDFVSTVFHSGLVDFGYLDSLCTSGDPEFPYQSVALWWDFFAEYYDMPFYSEMRLDRIFVEEGDWSYTTEIINQLKALYNCPAFDGSCFFNASVLRNNKHLARELSVFLNDVAGSNSDSFNLTALTVSDTTIKFTGKSSSKMNLFCNDKTVQISGGKFKYTSKLKAGMNEFKFCGNGDSYVHSIYNNSSLFTSFSSSDSLIPDENKQLYVFAECPTGSLVYAVVNGSCYQMSPKVSDTDAPDSTNTVYECSISFLKQQMISDKLDIICFYDGRNEVISCGSIKTDPETENQSVAVNQSEITLPSQLSPYTDNGLGTALMCVTKYDNTEIISSVKDYDTYHAYNSSLPLGTIDYVRKINVSNEGYLRYELESGLNVYGVDAVLINNGYRLPLNNILVENCDSTTGDVNLSFTLDWLSPVTVTVKDADFSVGYEKFSFNIKKFDAEYVDVNFYHSGQFSQSQNFTLENNPLFSHYELYSSGENALTMRLYLRNKGVFYGYDIKYNENNKLVISFNYLEKSSLSGKVIMLDPGHGGISMVGTALNDNSVSESQITLNIALYAKQYLESLGAKVIMTRTMDTSLSLSERTVMCEEQNPDIFVSIHCDGAANTDESGTHTFYYTPFSYNLATSIHNRIVSAYQSSVYSPADPNYANVDKKVKYYPFYVTRVDNCPSVLIETGFLTNDIEGNVLANSAHQNTIGNAIANGIADYFA